MAITSNAVMTKEDVLKFIDDNYADGEVIAWQTMSKTDVESALDGVEIADQVWEAFIEYTSNNMGMADSLSNEIVEWFTEFDTVIYPQMEEEE